MATRARGVRPLADDCVTLYQSPDPERVWAYSPGLARLDSGLLVATLDLGGPGVADLPGAKFARGEGGHSWKGKVFTSDDSGRTWIWRGDFPFMHARPFALGDDVYILGHAGDLTAMVSHDRGETWSQPAALTDGELWHQAPSNVHYANDCVYLVMERRVSGNIQTWYVGEMAPVLMRGRTGSDLTRRENWTFASELTFGDVVTGVERDPDLEFFGVPFFPCPYPKGSVPSPGRNCAPIGWLETNVVQFVDPDHYWFDPQGRTHHLWMRAHTGGTGYAAVLKVVEDEAGKGEMTTCLERVPSGKKILYVPCPGGQMKFHILYDGETSLYWLLSTQATDSMRRADRLPEGRFNLPNNERRRLQLHFSRNCVDWCFAGLVAVGPADHASRHYASMIIDDRHLQVLSRSGDERAHDAHNGNLITLHTVEDFRGLVY